MVDRPIDPFSYEILGGLREERLRKLALRRAAHGPATALQGRSRVNLTEFIPWVRRTPPAALRDIAERQRSLRNA